MRKYRTIVNGTEYEVVIELLDEAVDPATVSVASSIQRNPISRQPGRPAARTASVQSAPTAAVKPRSSVNTADGVAVKLPMPGKLVSLSVSNGTEVKKGQGIAVLEAMKMENEITAPADGVICELNVKEGESVAGGTLLCVIK